MDLKSFEGLFIDQLKDLHSAEKQETRVLPKMKKEASSAELREALDEHLEQTRTQLARLEKIFKKMGQSVGRTRCRAMEGIIEESEEYLGQQGDPAVKDAALIAMAQRVEHYEIAGYGTARTFADMLGYKDEAKMLQQILDEEYKANDKLTELAVSKINREAV